MIHDAARSHIDFLIKEADEELLRYIEVNASVELIRRFAKQCPICTLLSDSDATYCKDCGYYFGKEAGNTSCANVSRGKD